MKGLWVVTFEMLAHSEVVEDCTRHHVLLDQLEHVWVQSTHSDFRLEHLNLGYDRPWISGERDHASEYQQEIVLVPDGVEIEDEIRVNVAWSHMAHDGFDNQVTVPLILQD